MEFELRESGLELVCDHPDFPCDRTNLIWRAAEGLQQLTGCTLGARIEVRKRIPIGAGLGGGSSNAATALLALTRLWKLNLAPIELFRIGSGLGADVPFFLLGGTGVGIGRGDEVYPLPDVVAEHMLLVNPGVLVPTRQIYANLPSELTKAPVINKMPFSLATGYACIQRPVKGEIAWRGELRNDLELPALALYPVIGQVKQRLVELNAASVLMSGSGSTVFAIFESDADVTRALDSLEPSGWWCAKVRTLSRAEYQSAIESHPGVGADATE